MMRTVAHYRELWQLFCHEVDDPVPFYTRMASDVADVVEERYGPVRGLRLADLAAKYEREAAKSAVFADNIERVVARTRRHVEAVRTRPRRGVLGVIRHQRRDRRLSSRSMMRLNTGRSIVPPDTLSSCGCMTIWTPPRSPQARMAAS